MGNTKESYNWFSNILFNMKSARAWDKWLLYYPFLSVVPGVLETYLGLLIPSELVRGLEEQWALEQLVLYICGLSFLMLFSGMAYQGMKEYIYRNSVTLGMYYETRCYEKIMKLDYHMLQEPECAKLIGSTWGVLSNDFATRNSINVVPQILSGGLGVVWYGGMIAKNSPVIIALAVAHAWINLVIIRFLRGKQQKYHKQVGKYAKQTAYISRQAMDRQAGKDIRIYQMQEWFMKKYEEALAGMDGIYKAIRNGNFGKAVVDALILFVLNGFSYIYLIRLLGEGKIEISAFVLQIGLIGSFSGALKLLMDQILGMNSVNISLNYIRRFLELEEDESWSKEGVGKEIVSQIKQDGIHIQLRNVSYRYPKEEKSTLSHINLNVMPGERLALIGLNGAGKTTLVKLLCGFYRPTEGEIFINDIPISHFSRAEYFDLVTVLFQESTLLPLTLDKNLTGKAPEEIDREQLKWALEISGFAFKYESLPEKGETLLVREANKEALDFSGGERQKMLFARALYKVAPLMILDEPTAALDPIAENQMYQNFAEAAKGRTCVYISHRLSSTRFCDRILLMENGQIIEEGTHDALMAKNGRYAELYEIQSKYYKEQAAVVKEDTYE